MASIPKARDSDGKTVLHQILAKTDWEVESVKQWLQQGADPNIKDRLGQACVFSRCIRWDRVEDRKKVIQELLIAGLDLDTRDRQGRNVVLHAAQQGYLEILRTPHDCGTEFSAKDFQGKKDSPAHACWKTHVPWISRQCGL